MAGLIKRMGVYHLDIYHQGKRVRKSLKTKSKALANKILTQVIDDSVMEDFSFKRLDFMIKEKSIPSLEEIELKSHNTLFKDWAPVWFESHKKKIKPSHAKTCAENLNNHLLGFFGNNKLKEIDFTLVEKFQHSLSKKLKPQTINAKVRQLGKMLKDAVKRKLIIAVPEFPEPLPAQAYDWDYLTEEECRLLLSKIDVTRDYTLFLFAIRTGMRLGEILALKWKNIQFHSGLYGRVHVKQTYVQGEFVPPKTKSSIRFVPLSKDIAEALKVHRAQSKPNPLNLVFTNEVNGILDGSRVYKRLQKYLKRVGLRSIRFHDLRHTAASILATKSVSLQRIKELLGHSTINMTERYAHLAPSDLDSVVNLLEPMN